MAEETVLNNFNLVTFKTEKGFQNHIDEIGEFDLVFTPDRSLKGTLLDFKWADHILNDISWLRADTFSWHSGDVYVAAYNHLVADFEGTVAETTTIDGIEITYYLADDKHIICLPDQEDKLLELYNKTGVAWYYILDTANKQFKLPRTKFGFTGLRDEVGGYVKPGIPNLKGMLVGNGLRIENGDFFQNGTNKAWYGDNIHTNVNNTVEYDASNVSPVYNNSNTVQPPATQMYLYFYVGCFDKEGLEQTAGIAAEMFNSKADSDLRNIPANYDYVVESQMPTEANGYTWYRKYKSGWVEMGGIDGSGTGTKTITFPVVMQDGNYIVTTATQSNTATHGATVQNPTTTTVQLVKSNTRCYWQVCGMAA